MHQKQTRKANTKTGYMNLGINGNVSKWCCICKHKVFYPHPFEQDYSPETRGIACRCMLRVVHDLHIAAAFFQNGCQFNLA